MAQCIGCKAERRLHLAEKSMRQSSLVLLVCLPMTFELRQPLKKTGRNRFWRERCFDVFFEREMF